MSEQNVQIVRRMSEAFNRDGLTGLRPFLDPEFEYHEDPSFPEGRTYYGIEAYEGYAQRFFAEFSEIHYEVGECTDAGDHVIANMLIRGRGKASGAEFELSAWWAMTIRDRRVIRLFAYLDRDRAREAIGLQE
jgi:ketosteroid isomerase-like protein